MKQLRNVILNRRKKKYQNVLPQRVHRVFTSIISGWYFLQLSQNYVYATTVWSKANDIMKDVYTQILSISTIAAIVTASIALLMMNFSKSGKTVDESRAWLKRIAITWAILNGLGFIMSYVTPFFSGGKYGG